MFRFDKARKLRNIRSRAITIELGGDAVALKLAEQLKPIVVSKVAGNRNIEKRPGLQYVAPGLEFVSLPINPNLFDGFVVSGRASGSHINASEVHITISGVTRHSRILDGLWSARFEDGALPMHYCGNKAIVAELRDERGQTVRLTETMMFERFVDSFVSIDEEHWITGTGTDKELHVKGELNLGTHLTDRELIVLLVRDDAEAAVVATGTVTGGWQYGEWRSRIPLAKVKSGQYRARALLIDGANATLGRVMTGAQAILV
jgi:hypothetical protein